MADTETAHDDGNGGLFLTETVQSLAAARDNDVNITVKGQKLADVIAIGTVHEGDRSLIHPLAL